MKIDRVDFKFPILDSVVRVLATGKIGIIVRGKGRDKILILNPYIKGLLGEEHESNEYEVVMLSVKQVKELVSDAQNPIITPFKDEVLGFFKEYVKAIRAKEVPTVCSHCGTESDQLTEVSGVVCCPQCRSEKYFKCDCCGNDFEIDSGVNVGEKMVCSSCYQFHTRMCGVCNTRKLIMDMTQIDSSYVCHECNNEENVAKCCLCGHELVKNYTEMIDGNYYCRHCRDRAITGYHCGPRLSFYGCGKYHMGVEIEVDDGDESIKEVSALKVRKILEDRVYCSRDGSLLTGFEIVSHPHTYEEMIALPWGEAFRALTKDGWRGHSTKTAGLHIHISRCCFDNEDAITRFCTFFENNWAFVRAFSRRGKDALMQWASRYYKEEADTMRFTLAQIKDAKDCDASRYRAVNLTNDKTVEVRVFRSTLNVDTFLASIELVRLVAEKCNLITDEEAEKMSVAEWLSGASDNLKRRCAARGHNIDFLQNTAEEEKLCA